MHSALVFSSTTRAQCEVTRSMTRSGWRVRWLSVDEDWEEAFASAKPDAVVLVVPTGAGVRTYLSELPEVVRGDEYPVLVVCDDTSSATLAAAHWVHDFALRPLRRDELMTRLQRLVTGKGPPRDVLTVGELSLDLKAFEVSVGGAPIGFTYQEFRLLRFLMQHPGEAFSRDQLLARVWSYDYYGGPRTVDIHIRRLRAKLETPYSAYVETVRCVGYRWSPTETTTG